jgi:heme/copper-type cytochrome/quinol oxidase subunit 2
MRFVRTINRQVSIPRFWIGLSILAILVLTLPIPHWAAASQERYFRVEASRFAYKPSILRVNPGDHVTIDLVAQDVIHGLSVDGYDLEISADPGQTSRLTFVADQAGAFRLRCSTTCGPMHPFMIGKLQVGANELYWRGAILALLLSLTGVWEVRR